MADRALASLWFAKRYGFRHVIAVEAAPSNARLARRNFDQNGVHGDVRNLAAGADDGSATFLEMSASTFSRLVFDEEDPVAHPGLKIIARYNVPVRSMESILCDMPLDSRISLLKLDIEGGEQALLTADVAWLNRVDEIIAEFHPPVADVARLITILGDSGFDCSPPAENSEIHLHRFLRRSKPL